MLRFTLLRSSSSPTVQWSRWTTTSARVGYNATTTSGRATFSLSKPLFSAVRKQADSELNVECLISRDVETICVKGRARSICAIYSVAVQKTGGPQGSFVELARARSRRRADLFRREFLLSTCHRAHPSRQKTEPPRAPGLHHAGCQHHTIRASAILIIANTTLGPIDHWWSFYVWITMPAFPFVTPLLTLSSY